MDDNNIFGWDNYDDNPLNAIGVNTIPVQKNATWSEPAQGELVTTQWETFASNGDEYAYPQAAQVIGDEPMDLVFGEGYVVPEDLKVAITITAKGGTYAEVTDIPEGTKTENLSTYVDITGTFNDGDELTSITLTKSEKTGGGYEVTPSAAQVGNNTGKYKFTYVAGTWTTE